MAARVSGGGAGHKARHLCRKTRPLATSRATWGRKSRGRGLGLPGVQGPPGPCNPPCLCTCSPQLPHARGGRGPRRGWRYARQPPPRPPAPCPPCARAGTMRCAQPSGCGSGCRPRSTANFIYFNFICGEGHRRCMSRAPQEHTQGWLEGCINVAAEAAETPPPPHPPTSVTSMLHPPPKQAPRNWTTLGSRQARRMVISRWGGGGAWR